MDTEYLALADAALRAVRVLLDPESRDDVRARESVAEELATVFWGNRDRREQPMKESVAMRLAEARGLWDTAYAERYGALTAPRT